MSDSKKKSGVKKYAKWIPFLIAIASAIAAFTPNNSDDRILKTLNSIVNATALNVMNAAPESHE